MFHQPTDILVYPDGQWFFQLLKHSRKLPWTLKMRKFRRGTSNFNYREFGRCPAVRFRECIWWFFMSMWLFPKIGGKPPKWMVKIMDNPMNKCVFFYFWKHPFDLEIDPWNSWWTTPLLQRCLFFSEKAIQGLPGFSAPSWKLRYMCDRVDQLPWHFHIIWG